MVLEKGKESKKVKIHPSVINKPYETLPSLVEDKPGRQAFLTQGRFCYH